jgi:hemolysin-activating ACP:hemolysin acyltransferase
MNFIFNKEKLKEIHQVVDFYKQFNRYDKNTKEDIYYHVLPSFKLNQYKIHKDDNNMIIAFTNWAFLSEDAEKCFISTGILNYDDWKSGSNVWHIDTICGKNIIKVMNWSKRYFTQLLGFNKPVHWLRIDKDNHIYRKVTNFTKESYL